MSEPVREEFCDFDTAWRIQRDGVTHTDQRCSAVQTNGGMLCDCGAVATEWARRVAVQRGETAPAAPLDLEAIEQRTNLATPGPWTVGLPTRGYPQRVTNEGAMIIAQTYTSPEFPPTDAEFIAYARTDVPALLARVRELEQQLSDAQSFLADPNPVAANVAARVTGVLGMGDAQ